MYLIRKRQLGDVVWIEPIIRKLSLKHNKLIVHTKYNEIFKHNNYKNVFFKDKLNFFEKIFIYVDKILQTNLFSINLDGVYEQDTQKHILHAYQKFANLPIENIYPSIQFSKEEELLNLVDKDKYAIIHIESFSSRNYRNIFDVEWGIVAKKLNEMGYHVIQVGKNNQNIPNTSFLRTSIRDLMILIKKSSLFIGIDSFPSHLAAIFKIPSLIFFGAINPDYRHFRDQFNGKFLQNYCEFLGCYHSSKNGKEVSCVLVGDFGKPKCSVFETNFITQEIDNLIKN